MLEVMDEQIEDGVADDRALLRTIQLPLADPPVGVVEMEMTCQRLQHNQSQWTESRCPMLRLSLGHSCLWLQAGRAFWKQVACVRTISLVPRRTPGMCCHAHRNGWKQVCHFGPRELLAFLVVWRLQGPLHATANSHVHAKAPTLTEIKCWIDANPG